MIGVSDLILSGESEGLDIVNGRRKLEYSHISLRSFPVWEKMIVLEWVHAYIIY